MSDAQTEVLEANRHYAAAFGDKANLPFPPARRIAILTCMDARIDPLRLAGLVEGDAHVIRNAGARASDDAIRSLVISHKLMGTEHWFVIHHTECGLAYISGEALGRLLETSLTTAERCENGWKNKQEEGGSSEGHFVNWLAIGDQSRTVVEDVKRIRHHPLVASHIAIYGYIFDVKTGALIEVPEATKAGAPK